MSISLNLRSVLMATKLLLAVRCFLCAALPPSKPWLVLLIQPLHGLTFAAMWSANVEYCQEIAPAGCGSLMFVLACGIYSQVAIGTGTAMWGHLAMEPPNGLGFRRCFHLATMLVLLWALIWQLGILIRRRLRTAETAEELQVLPVSPEEGSDIVF